MTLHFYFDECADEDVARALVALGIDAVTAAMAGRKGLSDQEQLDFARQENRAVYTVDPDFLRIAADF
jgi:predicted nuclease of predicted toxin-antitoxin system